MRETVERGTSTRRAISQATRRRRRSRTIRRTLEGSVAPGQAWGRELRSDRLEAPPSRYRCSQRKAVRSLTPAEAAAIPTVPGSLDEALNALEEDQEFLLKGDVFTKDVLAIWIESKREHLDALRLRPHPYEFHLYFDV